jgi:hypothetical protein
LRERLKAKLEHGQKGDSPPSGKGTVPLLSVSFPAA